MSSFSFLSSSVDSLTGYFISSENRSHNYRTPTIKYDKNVIKPEKTIATKNVAIIFSQLLNITSLSHIFSINENPIESHIVNPTAQKQMAYNIFFIKPPYSFSCISFISISPISSDSNCRSTFNEFKVSNCCSIY